MFQMRRRSLTFAGVFIGGAEMGSNVVSSVMIPELFSVRDKVVLITGAGGMGEVYAKAFAANKAKVAIASRRRESLEKIREKLNGEGYECSVYQVDVADKEAVETTVQQIEADFGRIDVLIHTPAIAKLGPSLDFNEKDFRDTIDINFFGAVYMNVAAAKVMRKNKWGRIININSIDGFSVNCVDDLPYSASKSAMMALTRHLAVDLAKEGVTVNGIAPVWIWTPMMEQRPGDYMVKAAETIPMGRCSYCEDYLGMTFFLASEASAYVTGQTFFVDGGWSVCRAFKYSEQ